MALERQTDGNAPHFSGLTRFDAHPEVDTDGIKVRSAHLARFLSGLGRALARMPTMWLKCAHPQGCSV